MTFRWRVKPGALERVLSIFRWQRTEGKIVNSLPKSLLYLAASSASASEL